MYKLLNVLNAVLSSWEPYESFAGSEHFVQAFWDRISGDRDRTRMELFKVGEEVFPVGPPGSTFICYCLT